VTLLLIQSQMTIIFQSTCIGRRGIMSSGNWISVDTLMCETCGRPVMHLHCSFEKNRLQSDPIPGEYTLHLLFETSREFQISLILCLCTVIKQFEF